MNFKDFFFSEAYEPKSGFCGSPKMPESLARKLIATTIETHYYAAATEGASYDEIVKFAFDPQVLIDALEGMFCDALPATINVLIKDELNKHPLKDANTKLSRDEAQTKWNEATERFQNITAQIEEFCTRGEHLEESLKAEKLLFDNPAEDRELEIDEEDDNEGLIHYMGYEFPVSKTNRGGHVSYLVGSVAKSITISGNGPNAFLKVIAALDAGKVPAVSKQKSSIFTKVQRDIPDVVEIKMMNGKLKEYMYVAPGDVDALVTRLYDEYGPNDYTEVMKQYATDRPSGDIHNPYIPITQTARQNVFRHKLGTKDGSINYKTR